MTKPRRAPIVPPVVFLVLAAVTIALVYVWEAWSCDSGTDAAGRGLSNAIGEALQMLGFAYVGLLALLFAVIRNAIFRALLAVLLVMPASVFAYAVAEQYRFCQIVAQPMPPTPDDDTMMDPDPPVPPVRTIPLSPSPSR